MTIFDWSVGDVRVALIAAYITGVSVGLLVGALWAIAITRKDA